MTNAEKYLEKLGLPNTDLCLYDTKAEKDLFLSDILETYHKAKVESITDEEIEDQAYCTAFGTEEVYNNYIKGAKWLKQKLLEQ